MELADGSLIMTNQRGLSFVGCAFIYQLLDMLIAAISTPIVKGSIVQQIKNSPMRNQTSKLTDELQNEVSNLIRRMKQRQQQHRRIYQYNNRIIASREALEQNIFIHDEISKHRAFINERKVVELVFSESDQQLTSLCNQIEEQGKETLDILIKRVTTRVLQIAFSAVDLMAEPIQYYLLTYNKFKMHVLETISSQEEVKLAVLVTFFSKYFHHKISIEIDRLKQVIYSLQVADFNNLEHLKYNFYAILMRKEHPNGERLQTITSPIKRMVRKRSPPKQTMVQKKVAYQKIKKLQLDIKKKEKANKMYLKRIVRAISEVMDICKDQLMEDITAQNKTWESRRMFGDLMDRNKVNCSQLELFRAKSESFQQVIARKDKFEKTPLEEYPLVEEKFAKQKNQQTLPTKKSNPSVKDKRSSQPVLSRRQHKYSDISLAKGKAKPISSLHRMTINNLEQADHLTKQKVFASQKQITHESDFVEIIMKQPSNGSKQRLPEINIRATSVDAKKTNIIKIIEKQMRNKNKLGDENGEKEAVGIHVGKQIQGKVKQRQKRESKLNVELKTLGSNFFDEIDRKINYYCEMKKNLN